MFPGRGGMIRPMGPGPLSRVSNITNSNDPHLMNCRVFVGNLNTFQVKKEDVENAFKKYGRITGISMHKGFAFVQYMNQRHARLAVQNEDQKFFAGQKLDVNISTEPKNKQMARKRGAGMEPESPVFNSAPRMGPPMKRMRPDVNQSMKRTLVPLSGPNLANNNKTATHASSKPVPSTAGIQHYDSPDILICGNCKSLFSNLEKLVNHRKQQCRLRFMCKCNAAETTQKKSDEPASFDCATCKAEFTCCWELVKHCQVTHGVAIYLDPNEPKSEAESDSQDNESEKIEEQETVTEDEEKEKSNGQEEELGLEDGDEAEEEEEEGHEEEGHEDEGHEEEGHEDEGHEEDVDEDALLDD